MARISLSTRLPGSLPDLFRLLMPVSAPDLFDLEDCDDSGATAYVVDTRDRDPTILTPQQMRDNGLLDHELNELRFLIYCARRIRRAQEQRDISTLREFRLEVRRIAARPESLVSQMLANYLAEQDRLTTPWYQKQRRLARRAEQQTTLAA